ncbi:MAG: ribosomal protein S18-alanine N-acetyltransferase [Acidobacteriota bacterium]
MEFSIVPMTEADIPVVLETERESEPDPWSAQTFREEVGKSNAYVARLSDGAVAGYVCFWLVADEIQILNIAVLERFRRKGIGQALLAHAFRVGRGARVAVLEVRQSNIGAQAFYENLGFRVVGARPNYYGVIREAAVLMELDLGAASTMFSHSME